MLKWMRSEDPPCPWDTRVLIRAAGLGDLPKLRWLHENGCEVDGQAYLAAASEEEHRPHKHILRWLHQAGVPPPPNPLPYDYKSRPVRLFMADQGFPLEPVHSKRVDMARQSFRTFHGLLRWCRRAVSDPTACDAYRAYDYLAPSWAGQHLFVRISQLPPELITKISVADELQQDIVP